MCVCWRPLCFARCEYLHDCGSAGSEIFSIFSIFYTRHTPKKNEKGTSNRQKQQKKQTKTATYSNKMNRLFLTVYKWNFPIFFGYSPEWKARKKCLKNVERKTKETTTTRNNNNNQLLKFILLTLTETKKIVFVCVELIFAGNNMFVYINTIARTHPKPCKAQTNKQKEPKS